MFYGISIPVLHIRASHNHLSSHYIDINWLSWWFIDCLWSHVLPAAHSLVSELVVLSYWQHTPLMFASNVTSYTYFHSAQSNDMIHTVSVCFERQTKPTSSRCLIVVSTHLFLNAERFYAIFASILKFKFVFVWPRCAYLNWLSTCSPKVLNCRELTQKWSDLRQKRSPCVFIA